MLGIIAASPANQFLHKSKLRLYYFFSFSENMRLYYWAGLRGVRCRPDDDGCGLQNQIELHGRAFPIQRFRLRFFENCKRAHNPAPLWAGPFPFFFTLTFSKKKVQNSFVSFFLFCSSLWIVLFKKKLFSSIHSSSKKNHELCFSKSMNFLN